MHAPSAGREINAGTQLTSSFIQIWTETHSTVLQKVPRVPRSTTQPNHTRFLDLLSLSLTPSSRVYSQVKMPVHMSLASDLLPLVNPN